MYRISGEVILCGVGGGELQNVGYTQNIRNPIVVATAYVVCREIWLQRTKRSHIELQMFTFSTIKARVNWLLFTHTYSQCTQL